MHGCILLGHQSVGVCDGHVAGSYHVSRLRTACWVFRETIPDRCWIPAPGPLAAAVHQQCFVLDLLRLSAFR